MRAPIMLLWIAAAVQLTVCAANFLLPRILGYRENLSRLSPIVRQIFVAHSAYLVGVVCFFAVVTLTYPGELARGRGLGRFLAATIACFWLCRVPVQLLYYDRDLRRSHRFGDVLFAGSAMFLAAAYGLAALSR